MDDQREEEKKEQVQEKKEERKEEQKCDVPCNYCICERLIEHIHETSDSCKRHSIPMIEAGHGRQDHERKTQQKVSTSPVEATAVRRAAAVHFLPFYASRYEEVEEKLKSRRGEKE